MCACVRTKHPAAPTAKQETEKKKEVFDLKSHTWNSSLMLTGMTTGAMGVGDYIEMEVLCGLIVCF